MIIGENKFKYLMTCDLLYWQGEKVHCFFRYGDKRDWQFKYRIITFTSHNKNRVLPIRSKIFYALHNPQDNASLEALVKTATLNLEAITKER